MSRYHQSVPHKLFDSTKYKVPRSFVGSGGITTKNNLNEQMLDTMVVLRTAGLIQVLHFKAAYGERVTHNFCAKEAVGSLTP